MENKIEGVNVSLNSIQQFQRSWEDGTVCVIYQEFPKNVQKEKHQGRCTMASSDNVWKFQPIPLSRFRGVVEGKWDKQTDSMITIRRKYEN